MHRKRFLLGASVAVALLSFLSTAAPGQTYKILHSFGGSGDGSLPNAPMIFDGNGNLYGTTAGGGSTYCEPHGCGIVFELSPSSGGNWTETLFDPFSDCPGPEAPLAIDRLGNIYGICGTNTSSVFELSRGSNGSSLALINSLGAPAMGGVVMNSTGTIYGTTLNGGRYSQGSVYSETRITAIRWAGISLYSFSCTDDGCFPYAGVTPDAFGNLYGTTYSGAADGTGAVFKLTPTRGGAGWMETVLHAFQGSYHGGPDGGNPSAPVIFDSAGNMYGTTYYGGTSANGAVFEMKPNLNGTWTESVLYSFQGGSDGANPNGGLSLDHEGNLYGETLGGGSSNYGVVFKLTRGSGGQWTESILHTFTLLSDGGSPTGGLVLDATGNIYGTTEFGGPNGFYAGVAFVITP
ncbi:MAG: choice-of-anchor tandem repeat GloVer-containing protein [Candidatus Korobacteraceae bacterium]